MTVPAFISGVFILYIIAADSMNWNGERGTIANEPEENVE